MILLDNVLQASLFFLAMAAVFIPLERAYLAREKAIFRREWWTDVLFFFGQSLLWNAFTLFSLNYLFSLLGPSVLAPLQNTFAKQNLFLQAFEVILLSDFCIYWGHRMQHQFDFLWRFHRVHHTAESVDYIAAFREHPLDNIYTRGIETLPAFLLGFDLNWIAGFIAFRGIWALLIHSNINLRLGFLEYLIGAPHLHHWHHDKEKGGSCNFANLSPLMDLLFRSYYSPERATQTFGIQEPVGRSYWRLLVEPFFSKSWLQKIDSKITK
ncbi:MAG: sterol desaturase family protein [Spirochaetota bacterium]